MTIKQLNQFGISIKKDKQNGNRLIFNSINLDIGNTNLINNLENKDVIKLIYNSGFNNGYNASKEQCKNKILNTFGLL